MTKMNKYEKSAYEKKEEINAHMNEMNMYSMKVRMAVRRMYVSVSLCVCVILCYFSDRGSSVLLWVNCECIIIANRLCEVQQSMNLFTNL